jgi:hypothetical protein
VQTTLRQRNHALPCSPSERTKTQINKKPGVEDVKYEYTHLQLYSNRLPNAVFKSRISGFCSFPFVSSFANFSIWLDGIFDLCRHEKRRLLLQRKIHICWDRALMASEYVFHCPNDHHSVSFCNTFYVYAYFFKRDTNFLFSGSRGNLSSGEN